MSRCFDLIRHRRHFTPPAGLARLIGKGSQYAISFADTADKPFDGAKNYKVNIPANVPAADFWSMVVYDPQTRSELQTSQPFPV